MGLVWQVARMALLLQKGGTAENFVDLDPWAPVSSNVQGQGAGPVGSSKGSGLKEKVLKMASHGRPD